MNQHRDKYHKSWLYFFLSVFKNKIKEYKYEFCIFLSVVLFVSIGLILSLHFLKMLSTSKLITYNSMFIVAVVFLLTYHLRELRDIAGWISKKEDNKGKPFDYNQNKNIAEIKIVYVGSAILTLLLFVLSSFLIILGICTLIALILSLTSSFIILLLLILTLRTYIKTINDEANKKM